MHIELEDFRAGDNQRLENSINEQASSPKAEYITGANLMIDGGFSA